ncbi:MAG: hypothetical protein UT68_C0008G0002 [Parcubacteria group bacterium GW2011_GWC2_40_10]|nr:MAG: hypothetical protein UT68_C0008G0002 [Parcubacteria group bacterium GW2011_GWC2_40_10]
MPADLTSGNGYVGVGTRKKINSLLGKQTSEITTSSGLLRNLSVGSTGEDVKSLQTVLLNEGVYPSGLITGSGKEVPGKIQLRDTCASRFNKR